MRESISIPIVFIPVVITLLGAAITWGGTVARAEAIEVDVNEMEATVKELSKLAVEAHKGIALNEQAIRSIAEALANQHDTQKGSEQKLQQLIEIMLTNPTAPRG
tara:strand:- start:636 stop:950 length:315 start_codon:yes stop_codon:yes gene_type:complete